MIKRYDISLSRGVEDVPDGNWVKFEDLMWALKSLSYSVGIFHADYQSAARIAKEVK